MRGERGVAPNHRPPRMYRVWRNGDAGGVGWLSLAARCLFRFLFAPCEERGAGPHWWSGNREECSSAGGCGARRSNLIEFQERKGWEACVIKLAVWTYLSAGGRCGSLGIDVERFFWWSFLAGNGNLCVIVLWAWFGVFLAKSEVWHNLWLSFSMFFLFWPNIYIYIYFNMEHTYSIKTRRYCWSPNWLQKTGSSSSTLHGSQELYPYPKPLIHELAYWSINKIHP